MAKKELNKRCPLQDECERKCTCVGHELDCDYYAVNSYGEGRSIPDQDEIRSERERKQMESWYEDRMNNMPDEDDAPIPGKLVYIKIDHILPHPDNPRKELGDLSELAESIKANGILQNLTVVPFGDGYRVIIGHRRHAAAKLAGLTELPCIIADMSEEEQLSTMLVENMQRTDLTVYEQAKAFQQLSIDLGKSTAEISAMSGFSQGTVKRRLKMAELDHKTLKEVSSRQISLMDFDRLAQIENLTERNKVLKEIGTNNFNATIERQLRKQAINKNLPGIKSALKSLKAKAIKANDTWGSKYDKIADIRIEDWNAERPLVPEKEKRPLFYVLEEVYGQLRIYVAHKKAAPVKKSQAELDRAKAISAAWDRAKEINAITYKLRAEFVSGISMNSKNLTACMKGAVMASILRCIDYHSPDRDLYVKTLGLDDSSYDPKRGIKAIAAFKQMNTKDYPTLIYANFGDGERLTYTTGYSGEWPKHDQNYTLTALYDWLCSLGYEMSDEEKALQDGTHPVFKEG